MRRGRQAGEDHDRVVARSVQSPPALVGDHRLLDHPAAVQPSGAASRANLRAGRSAAVELEGVRASAMAMRAVYARLPFEQVREDSASEAAGYQRPGPGVSACRSRRAGS